MIVQAAYVFWIDPSASAIASGGSFDGRNFFVVVKDTEQKICFMLLFWAIALVAKEVINLEGHSYMFGVDLFRTRMLTTKQVLHFFNLLRGCPIRIRSTPLVTVISSALRRFALTGDVQSSASAIEPALDALAIQNDGRLTVLSAMSPGRCLQLAS